LFDPTPLRVVAELELTDDGETPTVYLAALKQADSGDFTQLNHFASS
jgi:hypothetical protein